MAGVVDLDALRRIGVGECGRRVTPESRPLGGEIHDGIENPEGRAPELQLPLPRELIRRVRADSRRALIPRFIVPYHANQTDLAPGPFALDVLARRILVQAHP